MTEAKSTIEAPDWSTIPAPIDDGATLTSEQTPLEPPRNIRLDAMPASCAELRLN
jgi:hypothetical protein